MTTQGKNKNHSNQAKQKGKEKVAPKADIKKEFTCFFGKKKEHLKEDCAKYKRWLEKKGHGKPKDADGKLVVHIIRKQDVLT